MSEYSGGLGEANHCVFVWLEIHPVCHLEVELKQ